MEDFPFTPCCPGGVGTGRSACPHIHHPQTLIKALCCPLPSTAQESRHSVTVDLGLSQTWNHTVLLSPGFFSPHNYSEMCPP